MHSGCMLCMQGSTAALQRHDQLVIAPASLVGRFPRREAVLRMGAYNPDSESDYTPPCLCSY